MGFGYTYRSLKDEASDSGSSAELEREDLLYSMYTPKGLRRRVPSPSIFVVSILVTAITSSWITYSMMRNGAKCSTADTELPPGVALGKIERSYYEKRRSHWNFTSNEWGHHPSEDPNVDALWNSLGLDYNNLWISRSDGEAMGIDPKENMWFPEIDKVGGQPAFPAVLEVTHQLHCLNEIRKNLWYNHEWYDTHEPKAVLPILELGHINHCVDALRQKLMCDADIGLVTWNWGEAMNWGLPNFHHVRKCHNFDATLEFYKQFEADEELLDHINVTGFYPPEDAMLRTYRSYFSNKDWEEWGHQAPMPTHDGRKWQHAVTPDVNPDASFY